MTIAAGLLCEHGIVLASDTRYTTAGIVNYGEKIFPLPAKQPFRVVVAGAGDVHFIRAASQKIEVALPLQSVSLDEIHAIVDSVNKDFFEQYILPHGGDANQRPGYELLIAVWHQQEGCLLLQTTENTTVKVSNYHLQGSGGITAEPYSGLWWENMPPFEAELAAIFLVKYAKTYDKFCGGDTRVLSLSNSSRLEQLQDDYIKAAEDYFTQFSKASLQMLLPANIDAELDKEFFEGSVKSLVEDLARRRVGLRKFRPHAYQLIP